MKVIKNINNNVSLCLDSNNNEVVAFGKGIGFTKPPYKVDLDKIQRTYYGIDPTYINMFNDIPEDILDISDKIINYARMKLENPVSSNIVITLADHINFAIWRYKENMNIKLPIVHDIEYLFDTEMEIGEYALTLIRKTLKVFLPKEEATYIALHIINAESMNKNKKRDKLDEEMIDDICEIIEKDFQIKIDKTGFNYSRFVSHMHYLLKRGKKNEMVKSENQKLYESLVNTYPKTYECTQHVREYLKDQLNWDLSDEECIYLMLHMNRLCAREDCYQ